MRSSPGSGRGTGGPSPCRARRRLRPPENVSFREKDSAEKNYSRTMMEQETSSSKLWWQHQGRLIYGVIVVAAKGTKSETQSHEMLIWQVALIQVILWQMHAWAAACINNFFISSQRCCQQRLNWTFRFSHSMHSRVVDINVEGEKQYNRVCDSKRFFIDSTDLRNDMQQQQPPPLTNCYYSTKQQQQLIFLLRAGSLSEHELSD